MIDFHSHILFDMDDGAETVEESISILKSMRDMGFETVALTPHFECDKNVNDFLERREQKAKLLLDELEKHEVSIRLLLGAEVYVNDDINFACDINRLTIGDSNVLLAEFQYRNLAPQKLIGYIEMLLKFNVRVMIAHPERYLYFRKDQVLVQKLYDMGAMFQINACSYVSEDERERASAHFFVENGYATVVGSDIHTARSVRANFKAHLRGMDRRDFVFLTQTSPQSIIDNK
ncbi:MAG: PHP domain-containing protein [Clostridia bacterium]|nr:PHP domain-containing protein [Clostridia bacterium]